MRQGGISGPSVGKVRIARESETSDGAGLGVINGGYEGASQRGKAPARSRDAHWCRKNCELGLTPAEGLAVTRWRHVRYVRFRVTIDGPPAWEQSEHRAESWIWVWCTNRPT